MCNNCQSSSYFASPLITKTYIIIIIITIIIIIIRKQYYHKLERSEFDEIFKESVDSLAKDECYSEYIRDQSKTLVMDKYLHQDVVVIYEKLTKNPDTEKFALYFMVKLF